MKELNNPTVIPFPMICNSLSSASAEDLEGPSWMREKIIFDLDQRVLYSCLKKVTDPLYGHEE